MNFYHLSKDDSLEQIVSSVSSITPNSIAPRIPCKSYAEDQAIPRVCVAPTVWQCVCSIPKDGTLYIYKIDTESVTTPVGGIADIELTDEKWITDEDVQLHNGRLEMLKIGFIKIDKQLKVNLQINYREGCLPVASDDDKSIWNISSKGQWSFKSDFTLR